MLDQLQYLSNIFHLTLLHNYNYEVRINLSSYTAGGADSAATFLYSDLKPKVVEEYFTRTIYGQFNNNCTDLPLCIRKIFIQIVGTSFDECSLIASGYRRIGKNS